MKNKITKTATLGLLLTLLGTASSDIAVFSKAKPKPVTVTKEVESEILTNVKERLLNAWSPALKSKSKVEVIFRLYKNGKASWIEVSDASSSTKVNQAATDAIAYAQPFKAFPKNVPYLDIRATFSSDLSSSSKGGYCRPTQERRVKAARLYKEAYQSKKDGGLAKATRKLEMALDASPFNFRIKRKYVDCLMALAKKDRESQDLLLHKALLALPRSMKVQMALDEYWKSNGKDPLDPKVRAALARQYDIEGRPLDAVAEFGIAWLLSPEPDLIPEINLAARHARAWEQVKKWKKLNEVRPSPGVTLSLSNALRKAGAYKESAKVFDKEFTEDPLELRKKELESVQQDKVSSMFPFALEDKKSLELSVVKNRKRVSNYLRHAIKNQKAVIRWTPGRFPLSVYVKSGRGVKGYKPIFNRMVIDCFNAWAKASQKRLSFRPVGSEKGANIVVKWTAKPHELKGLSGREQGITYFKYRKARKGNYTIDSAIITILTVRRSNTSIALGSTLMKSVILHELGHSLGIAGHSPSRSDIMFPALNPFTPIIQLSPRDKATIVRLYQGYEHQ